MENLYNEIWVFLSHSNEDYEKVKIVRDILEKDNFRPIMFFLKCLDNKDEIDTLIEREIKARTRFILCDSENAQKSNWVQREVEIIKSTGRMYETVNIDKPLNNIINDLKRFKWRSTVYISYSNSDSNFARSLSKELLNQDFKVLFAKKLLKPGDNYSLQITNDIKNASEQGYVLYLMSEYSLIPNWVRAELEFAIEQKGRIIPILLDKKILSSNKVIQQLIKDFWVIDVSEIPDNEKLGVVTNSILMLDRQKFQSQERTSLKDKELELLKNNIRVPDNFLNQESQYPRNKIVSPPYKPLGIATKDELLDVLLPLFVQVKGGQFQMGAADDQIANSDEKPRHLVRVNDFFISRYLLTQQIWEMVMGNNPSSFKGENRPVEMISWFDVQLFISTLNVKTGLAFRLPTEAEWEFAAKGGIYSKSTIYSGSNTLQDVAIVDNSTEIVGSKMANELGLYDMSGNIWEWCRDYYNAYYYSVSALDNPQCIEKTSRYVTRGGGWGSESQRCRVSYRGAAEPDVRSNKIGIRLVLSSHALCF